MMKHCIYHYLEPISDCPGKGSALRPNRMLQAFRSIGYEVENVVGSSSERKKKIQQIKNKIAQGVQYDFVYSESVNTPTILADLDHIPRHPFLDFSFLTFCRNKGIPVGLFYRDIHWKFPDIYDCCMPKWKSAFLKILFSYDLKQYNRAINLLYLPTDLMKNYVNVKRPFKVLPPGGDLHQEELTCRSERIPVKDGVLRIFYVGSISGFYDNRELVKAVHDTPNVQLTICTHAEQWQMNKDKYEPFLCDRVQIINKSSNELIEEYEHADIAACCMKDHEYLDLAMPIKVIEAITQGTPLLVSDSVSVSKLVDENQVGWSVKNSASMISQQLAYLRDHPEEIREKTRNTVQAAYKNTWEDRARQVVGDLTMLKEEK